jgi:hypothetical protein
VTLTPVRVTRTGWAPISTLAVSHGRLFSRSAGRNGRDFSRHFDRGRGGRPSRVDQAALEVGEFGMEGVDDLLAVEEVVSLKASEQDKYPLGGGCGALACFGVDGQAAYALTPHLAGILSRVVDWPGVTAWRSPVVALIRVQAPKVA